MARSADPEAAEEIWGTLEELLLAFAVSRHGTRSWDSVAMEVRTRSPSADRFLFTPEGCRKRYHKLQCRFSAADGEIGVGGEGGDGCGQPGVEIPWLEELRKLRVAELRREVQRHDVSIVSLQLKLKNLNEEREGSLREKDGEPDLNHKEERKDGESPGSGSVSDRISGEDSSRSSNSTNQKEEEAKPAAGFGETKAAPGAEDQIADPAAGADAKSAGEASCNGSSDTIAKAAAEANPPRPPVLGDSGESVAESRGGEAEAEGEGAKETSDLQSSARPSRRPRRLGLRRKLVSGSSNGGNEPEVDAVSPVCKRVAAESQPLIAFLAVIQAHKYGSVFERRLASQGSLRYRTLIRRHVDLEMVRAKMERRGCAEAYRSAEFFRDLLLLCCNAIVFYPKSSPESIAAVRLRGLVSKEMARTIRKPARPPKADEPTPPEHLLPPPPPPPPVSNFKSDPDRASQPLEKPISSGPFIACRKRRSLSGGVAGGATRGEEDKEKLRVLRKEREVDEYETPSKKRKKERSAVSGPRGFRSTKTSGNAGNSGSGVSKSPSPISTSTTKSTAAVKNSAEATAKSEKIDGGGETVSASNREGAGEIMNRMKRSSPTSNGALPNTRRRSASSDDCGKGAEKVKINVGRGDQRNRYSRQSSGAATSKRAAELSTPAKRSVGRPPKGAAAPPQAKKVKAQVGRKLRKRGRG